MGPPAQIAASPKAIQELLGRGTIGPMSDMGRMPLPPIRAAGSRVRGEYMKQLMAVAVCCTWLAVPGTSAREVIFEFDGGAQKVDPLNLAGKQEVGAVPAATSKDVLGAAIIGALATCSPHVRAAFLSRLEFRDGALVTVYDEDTRGCVSEQQMQRLVERISGSQKKPIRGRCGSPGTCHTNSPAWCTDNCYAEDSKAPSTPAPLFNACDRDVRKEFFQELTFRDGELTGMYLGGIKRCGGERDLDTFLSIFDQSLKGNWIREHKCEDRGTCTAEPNKACNTKTC